MGEVSGSGRDPGWPVHHLFDLDGVLTDSADAHARAWSQMFDDALRSHVVDELGIADVRPFDPVEDYLRYVDGRPRRDGVVQFLAARGVTAGRLGERSGVVDQLAARKDELFRAEVADGAVHVYDDAWPYLEWLEAEGARRAVVSSSRNARLVLTATGLERWIDVVVDGAVVDEEGLAGKPAPDAFLRAAAELGAERSACAVLEDAVVGVEAGRRGDLGLVIGIDRVGRPDRLRDAGADDVVSSLAELGPGWWATRATGAGRGRGGST
ncbi:HAD family hydrolase [Dermatobacter hominis]|uniref:HAD family hydrolase n=1 Tax=Dermatobacter hominis TaxID=2884263 RepID=UPI001D115C19|nr:HAD-IA family hydrolase [Dermatobacter hominis]UDY34154.1 HAD-IA family hydrolase [Dermatobacter hominis]